MDIYRGRTERGGGFKDQENLHKIASITFNAFNYLHKDHAVLKKCSKMCGSNTVCKVCSLAL